MAVTLNANTSTGFIATSDTSGVLQLQTAGTTALTVDASANVGIGTASPASDARLTLASPTAESYVMFSRTNSGVFDAAVGNNAGSLVFKGGADSATVAGLTEFMRIDSTGNVGIGVTPSAWAFSGSQALQVKNASFVGYLNRAYVNANLYFNSSGSPLYIASDFATQYVQINGENRWYTAPSGTAGNAISFTQAMTLDSSGNLLVGTTSTISVAGVSADHALVGTTGNGRWATAVRNAGNSTPWGLVIQYSAAAPNNTSQNFLYCYDTVAEKCSIRSNGGVANYSANNLNLASDLRLKHDIQPVKSYWSVFKSLGWKTWLYNDQTDEIKNIGVIAQELQALAPELVCESNALPTPEGESPYLGLWENDFKMAGMSVITELVKRCEEQQAIITSLTDRITALEGTTP